jgi:hypothetical protein
MWENGETLAVNAGGMRFQGVGSTSKLVTHPKKKQEKRWTELKM